MYLDKIVEATRIRVDEAKRAVPVDALEEKASARVEIRDFGGALRAPGLTLIAEIKRRSPSVGELGSDIDPAWLAREYEAGGALALSVLTEPAFFDGSAEDLQEARKATSLPVLRKDFIVDPYQIFETRAMGADALLIILAAIKDVGLVSDLIQQARDLGLAALVEIHDELEIDLAQQAGASIIGINQRNLHTFEIDMDLVPRLRHLVDEATTVVAESGIASHTDVQRLMSASVDAILVGEALIVSGKPREAARVLLDGAVR